MDLKIILTTIGKLHRPISSPGNWFLLYIFQNISICDSLVYAFANFDIQLINSDLTYTDESVHRQQCMMVYGGCGRRIYQVSMKIYILKGLNRNSLNILNKSCTKKVRWTSPWPRMFRFGMQICIQSFQGEKRGGSLGLVILPLTQPKYIFGIIERLNQVMCPAM